MIDLTLSNCLNSGLSQIYVLTQYKALSLNRHIRQVWNILSPELGQFIEAVPPTQRLRDTWYLGTADAVYQNMQSIVEEHLPYVLILSADHVYKMNYAHMLNWHVERGADVTVATTQISPSDSRRFGIVSMDAEYSIQDFDEKPPAERAARSRFHEDACSASMGVYLFSTPVLLEALLEDAEDESSSHDFGHDVLPKLMGRRRVVAYDFVDENKKEMVYWRDVGTLEAYFEANMDLVAVTPDFNLYDQEWPLRTSMPPLPPAKFVFASEGRCMGLALDSIVSHGCIISGRPGDAKRSFAGRACRVSRLRRELPAVLRSAGGRAQPYSERHRGSRPEDSGTRRHRLGSGDQPPRRSHRDRLGTGNRPRRFPRNQCAGNTPPACGSGTRQTAPQLHVLASNTPASRCPFRP